MFFSLKPSGLKPHSYIALKIFFTTSNRDRIFKVYFNCNLCVWICLHEMMHVLTVLLGCLGNIDSQMEIISFLHLLVIRSLFFYDIELLLI